MHEPVPSCRVRLLPIFAASLFIGSAAPVLAQSSGGHVDRLDIRGRVRFDENGALLDLVGLAPCDTGDGQRSMVSVKDVTLIRAVRTAGTGAPEANALPTAGNPPVASPWLPPFTDASPASTGILYDLPVGRVNATTEYDINATLQFDGGNDTYVTDRIHVGPIGDPSLLPACDPADPQVRCLNDRDIRECAGVIQVVFRDSAGNVLQCGDPMYPTGGSVVVRQVLPAPELGEVVQQATTNIRTGFETRFPVQAGICAGGPCAGSASQQYQVTVVVRQGKNPFCDVFSFSKTFADDVTTPADEDVVVTCGQLTTLTVDLPTPVLTDCCGPNPPPDCGGVIAGDWQVLGLENDVVYNIDPNDDPARTFPIIHLDRGGFENYRLGKVSPPASPDRSYPELGLFKLLNVPLSPLYVGADTENYRAWDFHVTNDNASFVDSGTGLWTLQPGGPLRGRPCGPRLDVDGDTMPDPCGRIQSVTTTFAQGPDQPVGDARLFTSEHLWSTCAGAAPADVPIDPAGNPDRQDDWLYFDAPGETLDRCPTFLTPPAACASVLTIRPQGTPPISAADEVKLFVLDPAIRDGRLLLRDGCPGTTQLDVLEAIDSTASILDNLTTAQPVYMASYIWSRGKVGISALCENHAAAASSGNEVRLTSSLLHNKEAWPADARGTEEYHFRLTPTQLANVSGWYDWNNVQLSFVRGGGEKDYLFGGVAVNRGGPASDLSEEQFAWDTGDNVTLDYCFGKLVVWVRSLNADVEDDTSTGRSYVEGATVDPYPADVGCAGSSSAVTDAACKFYGTTVNRAPDGNRWIRFNMAVPAGSYSVTPWVRFEGASGHTRFDAIQPCPIRCGEETRFCDDDAPQVTVSYTATPLDANCASTAAVTLCVADCTPAAPTVDILACSDTNALDPVPSMDPRCPPSHPYLVRELVDAPVTNDIGTCTSILLDLPLVGGIEPPNPPADGCGNETGYVFVVTDEPVDCAQSQPITTVTAPIVIEPIDDTPPGLLAPDDIFVCSPDDLPISLNALGLNPCVSLVGDNCDPNPRLSWTANPVFGCGGGATPATSTPPDSDAPCADVLSTGDVMYSVGTTHVAWTATDLCGNVSTPSDSQLYDTNIHVASRPVACVNGECSTDDPALRDGEVACRNADASALSVPLNATTSRPDRTPDCIADVLTYAWTSLTPLTCSVALDPNAPPGETGLAIATIPDPGSCEPGSECRVEMTVTETLPDGVARCTDVIAYDVHVKPVPMAVLTAPLEACEAPRATSTDVALAGCASIDCETGLADLPTDDSTVWIWSLTSVPGRPPCVGASLAFNDPLLGPFCSPSLRFDHAMIDDCATCRVELTVRDPQTGCTSAPAASVVTFLERPRPDAGGPYLGQCQPANADMRIQLDGSILSPAPRPPPTCCADPAVSVRWSVANCPGARFEPSDTDLDPELVIPATTDANQCEPCLTAWHCSGPVPGLDCSRTCCTRIEACRGPDADFDVQLVPLLTPNCNDGPLAVFHNLTTWGTCLGTHSATWDFGAGAVPAGYGPVTGGSADSDPPTPIDYTTPGKKDPSLTVSVDGECPDMAALPCGFCVPECVTMNGAIDGGFVIQLQCNDSRPIPPCSGDLLEVTIDVKGVDACCTDPSLAPGARAFLSVQGGSVPGGCDGGPITIEGTIVSSVAAGGDIQVLVTFPVNAIVDALIALDCSCTSDTDFDLLVRGQLVGAINCGAPPAAPCSLTSGPYFPLDVLTPNVNALEIRCQQASADCLDSPYTCSEHVCGDAADDDNDGLFDCADADCQFDSDGDGVGGTPCGADCNDADPAIRPGAIEDCSDGVDQDCDALIDCADPDCPVVDADADGVPKPPCGGDCDDSDPSNFPGNPEDCDNLRDDDCDGLIDQADPQCAECP